MVRNDILPLALIALFAVPAAQAITNCPVSDKTKEVYVRVPACANAPEQFTVKVNGIDRTVIRPDPKVAQWFVKMDQPFCISEVVLTDVNLPGFRTACKIPATRGGAAAAPVAFFDVPCAPVWQLTIVTPKPPPESKYKFNYTVKREPQLAACGDVPAAPLPGTTPEAIGDLGTRDDVVVSALVAKNKWLDVTVKETVLRAKPAGAAFGWLFRYSPARNEQTALVDDARADKVDLIFKKDSK